MSNKSVKRQILSWVIVFVLATSTFVNGQSSPTDLTLEDKRQIIQSLLKEKFGDSDEKTILISTVNLDDDLRNSFPTVKNKRVEFVSAERAEADCAYAFGEFEENGRFVSIAFGNCNEGIGYDFRKFGEKWKSVGLTIPR